MRPQEEPPKQSLTIEQEAQAFAQATPLNTLINSDEGRFAKDNPRALFGDARQEDPFTGEVTGQLNEFAFIAPLYGDLYVWDDEGNWQLYSRPVEDLPYIHHRLQRKILRDEHGFIPMPTIPPNPKGGVSDSINNHVWLGQIASGKWPIMLYDAKQEKGELVHGMVANSHDVADFHLANLALFPYEMNEQIIEAAGHGITNRFLHLDVNGNGGADPAFIFFSESLYEEDPDAFSPRGVARRADQTAISVIDSISDDKTYIRLVTALSSLPQTRREALFSRLKDWSSIESDEKRKEAIANATPANDTDYIHSLAASVINQKAMIRGIATFNLRARTAESLRQNHPRTLLQNISINGLKLRLEENDLAQLTDQYLNGIMRVASKLHGDYNWG